MEDLFLHSRVIRFLNENSCLVLEAEEERRK